MNNNDWKAARKKNKNWNKGFSYYIIPTIRAIYSLTLIDYLPYKYFLLRNSIPYYDFKLLK